MVAALVSLPACAQVDLPGRCVTQHLVALPQKISSVIDHGMDRRRVIRMQMLADGIDQRIDFGGIHLRRSVPKGCCHIVARA